jgi:cation transporter-like permease
MILSHIPGMFTHPHQEWESIEKEHSGPIKLSLYICLLALIGPVSAYISTTQSGWQIGEGQVIFLSQSSALTLSMLTYISIVVGVYVMGVMIDWMSKNYGSNPDEFAAKGIALMAYSCTPLFLVGLVSLYPEPWLNVLAYLAAAGYAAYLMYKGLPRVLKIPEDQAFFFIGAIMTTALVYMVATLIGTVIIWSVGFSPEFTTR